MCGIAGFVGCADGVAPGVLLRMREAVLHRGPDAGGLVLWGADGRETVDAEPGVAGLAHRRLSIIDLSPAGAQPMFNEDRSLAIAYNGEFYNFGDYRAELEAASHRFASRSDTETILHLYEQHGAEETFRRINGMFALALWDAPRRRLVLARDHVGKKPLFYVHRPDGSLWFASEIKALIAAGVVNTERLDPLGLDQCLTFGSGLGETTVYADVRQLPAGAFAVWENGRLHINRYTPRSPFLDREALREADLDALADELEALLVDAIRLRLIADVPVGLFLSGGIDSSLVAALVAKKLKVPLRAYTIAFGHSDYDESRYAKAVADHLELPFTVFEARGDMYPEFARVALQFDQPFGDASALPTYLVAREARREVTVALTGDGGDELFAGYYAQLLGLRIWGGAEGLLPEGRGDLPARWYWSQRLRGFDRGYLNVMSVFGARFKSAMYESRWHALRQHRETVETRRRLFDEVAHRHPLERMQHVDWVILADTILRKVDTTSMAVALECRCPLLDHRVASFAAHLPLQAKLEGGRGKRLLRHLLARHLPRELFERPKQGFCSPWEHWSKGDFARSLQQRWRSECPPGFRPDAAARVFPAEELGSSYRMWCAYTLLEFDRQRRGLGGLPS